MDKLWARCAHVVNSNICKFIMSIIAAGATVVMTLVPAVWNVYRELNDVVLLADMRSMSTAQGLDALTAETRSSNATLADTLQQIRTDLAIIKYRLDTSRMVDAKHAEQPPVELANE